MVCCEWRNPFPCNSSQKSDENRLETFSYFFRESLAISLEISADVLGTKTAHGLFVSEAKFVNEKAD